MTTRASESITQLIFSAWYHELIFSFNQILDIVHKYVDLPLQKIFCYYTYPSICCTRRRWLIDKLKCSTGYLVRSWTISFLLYFLLFISAQIFSNSIERVHFLDPFLSHDRQCIHIEFIHADRNRTLTNHEQLQTNFLRQNIIITDVIPTQNHSNYSQLFDLFDVLQGSYYIICQRSLYLYARFHAYSLLLNSNSSYYRFRLAQYPFAFSIDRPPFLDLCLHTSNRTQLNRMISRLRLLPSFHYASVNLFVFTYPFTQVSLTIYVLDNNSTNIERVSIRTGWLYELYERFSSFKYDRALSTALFDGVWLEENFLDYFDLISIPLPSDPLLAMNEMVQQTLMSLPLCSLR
jgi:hypothetical protein